MEDLTRMGCEGLLMEPWVLKREAMVVEFLQARFNEWEDTIRRDPEWWTRDSWMEVYSFRKDNKRKVERIDKLTDGKFRTSTNSKDEHAIADCVDPRKRRVLEFVMPILYLEKPSRVMLTMGNTIFSALSGFRKVNWGQVLQEIVDKLVSRSSRRYWQHLRDPRGSLPTSLLRRSHQSKTRARKPWQ